jgi:hypothetical protein
MTVFRSLRLSLVIVVAMACSSDSVSAPLRGFVYSAAVAQCGPADGPAVAVYLSPTPVGSIEPAGSYVRVYVPVQLNQVTGVWFVAGANASAGAWFHPSAGTVEIAESGYMIVNSVGADNTINGSVDLEFPNSGHIKSAFSATWLPTPAMCV